jgi:hypothetical protein
VGVVPPWPPSDHDRGVLAYARLFRHLILRRLNRIDEDDLPMQLPAWKDGWPKSVGLFLVGKTSKEDFRKQSIAAAQALEGHIPAKVMGGYSGPGASDYVAAEAGQSYAIGVDLERYPCEMNYFSGMIDLLEGRNSEASDEFNACLDSGKDLLAESGFARAELTAMGN